MPPHTTLRSAGSGTGAISIGSHAAGARHTAGHLCNVANGEPLPLCDALTQLPNRRLLHQRLQGALQYAQINTWTTGVMYVALDRFQAVNARHGDTEGDSVLRQVGQRLVRVVRRGDTVGRLEGDHFAVVLTNLAEGRDAEIVARKIAASLAIPFVLAAGELTVTASIGISLSPYDATDEDALMQAAEAAVREAKRRGGNRCRFFAVPGMPPS